MIAVTNAITTKMPGMTVANATSIAIERRCVRGRSSRPRGAAAAASGEDCVW